MNVTSFRVANFPNSLTYAQRYEWLVITFDHLQYLNGLEQTVSSHNITLYMKLEPNE